MTRRTYTQDELIEAINSARLQEGWRKAARVIDTAARSLAGSGDDDAIADARAQVAREME